MGVIEKSEGYKSFHAVRAQFDWAVIRASYNQKLVHAYDMNVEDDMYDINQPQVDQYESRLAVVIGIQARKIEGFTEKVMERYKVDPKDVEAYRPYHEAQIAQIQANIDKRISKN